jgi:purine-nucleoside phosphorylase
MTELSLGDMAVQAADYVRAHSHYSPQVGLILGSGMSPLAEHILNPDVILYREIPHFPQTTVAGHPGRLVIGNLSGVATLTMQGRAHYYEGHSATMLSLPVRVMQVLGVRILIVTNAAGGLRPGMQAGDLMAITDHINLVGLAGHNPLRGPNDDRLGPRFPAMTDAYDPQLLSLVQGEALKQSVTLHTGVYVMVAGPSFETAAEVRFLRLIGADAVGMSTASEVIVARHAGMRVLGISLISNVAIHGVEVLQAEASHDIVLRMGQQAVPALAMLIEGVLAHLSQS